MGVEHPILFSSPMVLAMLADRKSQTRRVIKPVRGFEHHNICNPDGAADSWAVWWHGADTDRVGCLQECPYGKPGDTLWVREAWSRWDDGGRQVVYRADLRRFWAYTEDGLWKICDAGYNLTDETVVDWKSPYFMPRWASRIDLLITGVRVEPVQGISDEDAQAEGVTTKDAYRVLWDSINGKTHPWAVNPLVWVITFNIVKVG